MILAIVDCILRAVMVVKDVVGLKEVTDDVDDVKMVLFCKISLVVALVMLIFVFFPFPGVPKSVMWLCKWKDNF